MKCLFFFCLRVCLLLLFCQGNLKKKWNSEKEKSLFCLPSIRVSFPTLRDISGSNLTLKPHIFFQKKPEWLFGKTSLVVNQASLVVNHFLKKKFCCTFFNVYIDKNLEILLFSFWLNFFSQVFQTFQFGSPVHFDCTSPTCI